MTTTKAPTIAPPVPLHADEEPHVTTKRAPKMRAKDISVFYGDRHRVPFEIGNQWVKTNRLRSHDTGLPRGNSRTVTAQERGARPGTFQRARPFDAVSSARRPAILPSM